MASKRIFRAAKKWNEFLGLDLKPSGIENPAVSAIFKHYGYCSNDTTFFSKHLFLCLPSSCFKKRFNSVSFIASPNAPF